MQRFATFLLLSLATTLLGCAVSTTPNYDLKFGDAVRQARAQMILNPNAGANADTAVGMDGIAAREATVHYQGTFKTPPPVVNVINIGGTVSGK